MISPETTAASGAYAMVGMAAVYAGVAKTPITAIILLFEMTTDYKIILPLLLAVVMSTVVSRALSSESIYTLKLVRRGIDIRQLEQTSPMREVTVGEAMTRNFPSVSPETSVRELISRFSRSGHHGFPVIGDDEKLVGIVTMSDVEAAVTGNEPDKLTVDEICTKNIVKAFPDEFIHNVFLRLNSRDVGRIPVVDRNNPNKLIGVLRRQDIIKAYTKAVGKPSRD